MLALHVLYYSYRYIGWSVLGIAGSRSCPCDLRPPLEILDRGGCDFVRTSTVCSYVRTCTPYMRSTLRTLSWLGTYDVLPDVTNSS